MVVGTALKSVLGFCLDYWVFNIALSPDWASSLFV